MHPGDADPTAVSGHQIPHIIRPGDAGDTPPPRGLIFGIVGGDRDGIHHRVVLRREAPGDGRIGGVHAGHKAYALIGHQADPPRDNAFGELHVRDAVEQDAAGLGVLFDDGDAVAPVVELIRDGEPRRARAHDGDVLLVQNSEGVEVGEAGIFVLDGAGYFKVYGGDCLISLNPEYGRIMLKDFENVSCIGKVLGRLRRR